MRAVLAFLILSLPLQASAAEQAPEAADPAFDLESVIHPEIAALPEAPADRPAIASIKMLVTTDSDAAQRHIRIGLNHLLGFWDLEAYRHFVLAARADPDCPMAFWGICVSLSTPGPTYAGQRIASFKRLKQLILNGRGNELEAQLAGALAALYSEGPRKAGTLFSLSAESHRAAVLPGLLACMTLRDGYDDFGDAREGQKVAIKFLADLVERHPDCPAVRFYQAALLEGAPDPADGLTFAEKLQDVAPNYPPYKEILGYFRFRQGDYQGAASAFQHAYDHYSSYFEQQQMPAHLTPSLHRCREWLCITRQLSGNGPGALELARQAAAIKVAEDKLYYPANTLLLWRARTLEARLHLANQDFKKAVDCLPGPRARSPFEEKSLAPQIWQHLRQSAEGRLAAKNGDLERARRFVDALEKFTRTLGEAQRGATAHGALNEWMQWSELFLRLRDELRGAISMHIGGDDLDSARIWLKSASDKSLPLEMASPPLIPLPPEALLWKVEKRRGDAAAARRAREQGLKHWPRHPALADPDPAAKAGEKD